MPATAAAPAPKDASTNDASTATATSTVSQEEVGTIEVFGNGWSRAPVVSWFLTEKGIPFTWLDVKADPEAKARSPHPFEKMPALRHTLPDSSVVELFESGAILSYLAELYGGANTAAQRAELNKWLFWANSDLCSMALPLSPAGKPVETSLLQDPPLPAMVTFDGILKDREWLVGDGFSVADIAVSAYLLYAVMFFPEVHLADTLPNVAAYCKRCATRPAYAAAFGKEPADAMAVGCDRTKAKKQKTSE